MCGSPHMVYYGPVQLCEIDNSFASNDGDIMLVALTRLNVSELEHWVTWSHRTGVNFPFLRGKRIQYFSVSA